MNEEQHDLADRRWFMVSDEQFAEFEALLSQSARDLPRLRARLATDLQEKL